MPGFYQKYMCVESKSCQFIAVKCTKPHNLRVQASGKRKLSVSWEPARDMEPQTPLLWYKIWYASEQSKANEVS